MSNVLNISTNKSAGGALVSLCGIAAAVAVITATGVSAVQASGIVGTLSNFDTYNNTPTDSDGAELELEGTHVSDVVGTYPSHYTNKTMTEYSDGSVFGTRIIFSDYKFQLDDVLSPAVNPPNTNGHTCVGLAGCEHFGFSVRQQPTVTRFYWLDADSQRINVEPMAIPNPVWTYIPPVNVGDPPRVAAVVELEPAEVIEQKPDSIWMKVYKTEIDRRVDLEELLSGMGGLVPEGDEPLETETEWELLEGGVMGGEDKEVKAEDDLGEGHVAVIRRYEFFEYTGPYDDEHEPTSIFLDQDLDAPPEGELGDFIAANMVAVNLVPEPASLCLALGGAGFLLAALRHRKQT